METIRLKDSGIREITIENEKGDVVSVLRVNVADREVAEKYGRIFDRLNAIAEEAEKKSKEFEEKNAGVELDFEKIRELTRMQIESIKDIIYEIDALFGKNTVKNVFKENYDIDDCFVPSEDMLMDFIKQIMPIMEKLFKKKFDATKAKYKPKRR